MKKYPRWTRHGPDILTEELANVLSVKTWFEFKPLFLLIHANLRLRNAANGGEEMLRLRVYEKLQNLVQVGGVEKSGKNYRGIPSGLAAFAKFLAAKHCSNLLRAVKHASPEPLGDC
jgi:hypothetical protein